MDLKIEKGDIETAWRVSCQVPELEDPHPPAEYRNRMREKTSLVLIAYVDGACAGFKVGYDKFGDGSFYSWMGGVVPQFRNLHVAKALAMHQEQWARENGYRRIVFKTRNKHKAMLHFALSNGFSIVDVEPREMLADYRILLCKDL
ncbi:MAG TPA: GNAT family N-acetyltransferase [Chryseosolibacter sp.]|nr:GNAT family N-acetyltransferase [Chryseosolibacter sp.]